MYSSDNYHIAIPNDFLCLAVKAMHRLKNVGRTNVLYSIAKGIGTPREDGDDSRLPTKRMPMGLLEYTANFFAASTMQQVNIIIIIIH